MARMRIVKPGFFTNEEMAELPPLTRLLFIGLWTVADRRGRLEDRPKRLKAELLPYDNHGIEPSLAALHDAGFITRYSIDGKNYIQINKFEKHQHCHVKEPESTIPAPCLHGANPSLTVTVTGTVTEQEHIKGEHGALSENSWNLFLSVFPKCNGKHLKLEQAREIFDKNPAKWNQWILSARHYADSDKVQRGFGICNADTFLTSTWKDWQTPEVKNAGSQNGGSGGRTESTRERKNREDREGSARLLGIRLPSAGLSPDVHAGRNAGTRSSGLDTKIIDSTCVEIKKA